MKKLLLLLVIPFLSFGQISVNKNGKIEKKIEPELNKNVLNIFDLKNSINSKKSFGGTSFNNIKKKLKSF